MTLPVPLVVGIALAVGSTALAGEDRPPLAILELQRVGAAELAAEAVSMHLIRAARELDAFQVYSADDVRQLMAIERQRQLLGDSSMELSVLSQGLGARYAVVGSVTQLRQALTVEIRLLDTADGKVLQQRSTGGAPTLEAAIPQLAPLMHSLLGSLLAEQTGLLRVSCSEGGAEVLVDAQLVASTPLRAPLTLSRGKHRLEVRKEGFITAVSAVTVTQGQTTTAQVDLLPSPEFVQQHQAHHRRLRLGAWLTTGLAVAAGATAVVVDRALSEPLYQKEFSPRVELLRQAAASPYLPDTEEFQAQVSGVCGSASLSDCRQQALETGAQLQTAQVVTYVLVGTAAASAVAATYFWIAGEDPQRYQSLQLVAGPSVQPNGAGLSVTGRF